MLAIDFREHFKTLRTKVKVFSPSAQAVLIHSLLCGGSFSPKTTELAENLGYSTMTISRAFDELTTQEIGKVISRGSECHSFAMDGMDQMNEMDRMDDAFGPVRKSPNCREDRKLPYL